MSAINHLATAPHWIINGLYIVIQANDVRVATSGYTPGKSYVETATRTAAEMMAVRPRTSRAAGQPPSIGPAQLHTASQLLATGISQVSIVE
jgi:hypothetical protein